MTRLLQMGMGAWGRNWARVVLPIVPGAELVGCVDPSEEALRLVGEETILGPDRCFADLKQALSVTNPEAVLITADPPSHATLVRLSLDAGLHVIVEKPFALSLDEAQELVKLAKSRELTLMVSQNYRFFPAVRKVRSIVASGRLGAVVSVALDFLQYSPEVPCEPHHRLEEPLLVDMSVHHFDLLRAVLTSEAQDVRCRTWNPPWSWFRGPPEGTALIDFDNGCTVSYRASWLSSETRTPWSGRWMMELENGRLWWTSRGDAMDGSDGESVYLAVPGEVAKPVAFQSMRFVDRAGCLAEFIGALHDGRQPESSGQENLGTVALMQAAVDSASQPASLAGSDRNKICGR